MVYHIGLFSFAIFLLNVILLVLNLYEQRLHSTTSYFLFVLSVSFFFSVCMGVAK